MYNSVEMSLKCSSGSWVELLPSNFERAERVDMSLAATEVHKHLVIVFSCES